MIARILDSLAPPLVRTPGRRHACMGMVLLAPAALIAGLALRVLNPVPEPARLIASRDELISSARRISALAGIPAGDLNASLRAEENKDRQYLAAGATPDELGVLVRIAPGHTFKAILAEADGERNIQIKLNGHGDALEFDASRYLTPGPLEPAGQQAEVARAFADSWLTFAPTRRITSWRQNSKGAIDFAAELPGTAGAKITGRIETHGTRVIRASIDESFSPQLEDRLERPEALAAILGVMATAIAIFAVVYSLRLFRRRSREQEAPKRNALILAITFGLFGGAYFMLNAEEFTSSSGAILPWYAGLLIGTAGALFMTLGGLLMGAAYASGEGEIREGYPGKLTSFDALLAGRTLSSNVGRSVVTGATVAAWLFLLCALAETLTGSRSAVLTQKEVVITAYSRFSWISGLAGMPLLIVWTVVSGLFFPLTFVRRNVHSERKRWAILILCPLITTLGFASLSTVTLAQSFTTALAVAALLIPFFAHDLLAALVASMLYGLVVHAANLAALAPHSIYSSAFQLGLVTVFVCWLARAAWTGATVTDAEVKPAYARNLDRRLSLRAEVSAAREAQLRLLPQAPPTIDGLSIAASCHPVGDVGADFYDFFPLSRGRLAIFVASGGGLGVASALTIALAKGFLMSDLRREDSPGRSLARLRELLTVRLGEVAHRARFAVAWIDPSTRQLEAARWGDVPALWILQRGGAAFEAYFQPHADGTHESRTQLEAGDAFVFHTEGLTSALEDQTSTGMRAWFNSLHADHAMELHQALLRRLAGKRQDRFVKRLNSDLTTVILRLER